MPIEIPKIPLTAVPTLSANQMREVDRVMIEDFNILLIQMMENAGRSLARVAIEVYEARRAIVLAGSGGNGGGGLVAARHMANSGVEVRVVLSRPPGDLHEVTAHQLDILERMGVHVETTVPRRHVGGVIVDALLGYSLTGAPHGMTADLIRWANSAHLPVISLDAPSGLDVTTGLAADPCIQASITLTLALPKVGLIAGNQPVPEVGRLILADISVPLAVYRRLGIDVGHIFHDRPLVELA